MYDFKFADIGDGIEEGKILEWKFKVGDKVKEGDTLVVVETDKVNAELPSPVDGTIVKRGPEEGEMIYVGETVVVIDDGTGGSVPTEEPKVEVVKETAPAQTKAANNAGGNYTYDFKFADIGDGIEEGKILEWKFNEGDKVNEGDTLVVVETDKVNAELPSPVTGTIVKRGPKEGEMIHVGETVVLLDDGSGNYVGGVAEAAPAPAEEEEKGASVIGEIEVSSQIIESSFESSKPKTPKRKKALATPVARNLARNLGVDINEVTGTGPNGRVMKEDIQKFADKDKTSAPSTVSTPRANVSRQGDIRVEPITAIRRSISNAMTQSKSIIPETVLMDDVVIDRLVELRAKAKASAAAKGVNLTYMAFISRAVIIALREFPIFNASFDHDKMEVIYKNFINLGFAVDTPAGLIVPNIKDADQLTIFELAKEIRELADKAIDRKISLPEIQNGTFTITNFGSAGISYGTAVINYPEMGILGVGKISQKPVVENGEIKISYVLPLSIAVDHRIIDGADAGRFLLRVKELLNNPELMLLS